MNNDIRTTLTEYSLIKRNQDGKPLGMEKESAYLITKDSHQRHSSNMNIQNANGVLVKKYSDNLR